MARILKNYFYLIVIFITVFSILDLKSDDNTQVIFQESVIRENSEILKKTEIISSVYNSLEYIIITPDTFFEAIKPLADWKNLKGVNTKLVNLSNVRSDYNGFDDPEKILKCLKDYKINNSLLKWVLLVGNEEYLPVRYAFVDDSYASDGDLVPSDMYYSDLTNNWDEDNDTLYAEDGFTEWFSDLIIGRLPFNSVNEISNFVNLVIDYEKNPTFDISSYYSAVLAGAMMNYPQVSYSMTDNAELINFVDEKFFTIGSNTTLLFEEEGYYPSNSVSDLNLSENDLSNSIINSSLVFISGHGSQNGLYSKVWLDDVNNNTFAEEIEVIYKKILDRNSFIGLEFKNNPFFYIDACNTGWYDDNETSLTENLLNNSAIGVISAVRTTWYEIGWTGEKHEIDGGGYYNQGLASRFWEYFWNNETTTYRPAEALAQAKLDYIDDDTIIDDYERKNILSYHYFGDPELAIYTKEPEEFIINRSYNGNPDEQSLEINVYNKDNPNKIIENATVNLIVTLDDEFNTTYSQKLLTNTEGKVNITIDYSQVKELAVIINKYNYRPLIIEKINIKPPDIILNNDEKIINSNSNNVTISWIESPINTNETIYFKLLLDNSTQWLDLGEKVYNYSFISLEDGNHTIILKAHDEYNNFITKTLELVIDTENPTLEIILETENNTFIKGETITIRVIARDEITWLEKFYYSLILNYNTNESVDYTKCITVNTGRSFVYERSLNGSVPLGNHLVNFTVTDYVGNYKTELFYFSVIENNTVSSSNDRTEISSFTSEDTSNTNNVTEDKITKIEINIIIAAFITIGSLKLKRMKKFK